MYLPFLIDPTIALMLLYCPSYVVMLLYHPLFSSKRYFSKYFHDNYQIFYCSTCPKDCFHILTLALLKYFRTLFYLLILISDRRTECCGEEYLLENFLQVSQVRLFVRRNYKNFLKSNWHFFDLQLSIE